MHETEDSHFNETHFYAKCSPFSLWQSIIIHSKTQHIIALWTAVIMFLTLSLTLDSLLILEQDSNELYTKKLNTVGLPIWWWRHRLYSNLKRDSLSENRNTGSACDFSFGFGVSWVIDKYINYGQLVLMFSDHDSIATGAWVLFRIYNFERERFDMEKRKRHSQSWSLSPHLSIIRS